VGHTLRLAPSPEGSAAQLGVQMVEGALLLARLHRYLAALGLCSVVRAASGTCGACGLSLTLV
jgi:hypothetical protein